ncbi:MAG: hypothetical protein U0703_12795 [Anaerolineae bacterium]
MTVAETDHLLTFLQAVDSGAGAFPPKPINVSGGLPEGIAGAVSASSAAATVPTDPVEAGITGSRARPPTAPPATRSSRTW